MSEYNFSAIEKTWQRHGLENKTFKTDSSAEGEKFYCLDMFPYPSGAGLHVGHPEWLVQFAIMGNAYSKAVLKRTTPAVGLISIGTEDCKGNEMTKQTFPLLKEVKDLNFVGNIEGKDLYKG